VMIGDVGRPMRLTAFVGWAACDEACCPVISGAHRISLCCWIERIRGHFDIIFRERVVIFRRRRHWTLKLEGFFGFV
jgi:hypothetical protein